MNAATRRAASLAVCLLPMAWGCAVAKPTQRYTPAGLSEIAMGTAGGGIRHTVEAGQTLWRIARVYGVPLEDLAHVNGIDDPATLEVGHALLVPGATELREVPPYPLPLAASEPDERARPATPGPTPAWPVADGRILAGYGVPRNDRRHHGVDIGGRPGEPVLAALDGLVVYTGSTMRGYGRTVILDHGDGLSTLYAHGSALLVREGQRVRRGQPIARIGRSGNASTAHCHFEIRRDDVPVDPLRYLNGGEETR